MADAAQPVRLGIIGCGRATLVLHVPALRNVPAVRVVAVADPDEGRRNEAAGRLGAGRRYSTADALLASGDIDAVGVITPTASHADLGVQVLESGRHLLVEKPLALDREACARLAAAQAAAARCALVGHNGRWHRLVRDARAFIRGGRLGPIKAVLSVYTHWHPDASSQPWHRRRADGGGVLFNDGVHHFDLWRYLLDAEIADVSARSRRSATYDDDTCVVEATMSNGVLASAVLSFTTAPASTIDVFGEAGRLSVSMYRFDGLRFLPNTAYEGSLAWRAGSLARSLAALPRAMAARGGGSEFERSYAAMWAHFAACATGRATPECTLGDGRAAVEVARAAIESAEVGRPVALGPAPGAQPAA